MQTGTNVNSYIPRVLRYLRPYSWLAVVAVMLTGLAAALGVVAPLPMLLLIDNVLGDHALPEYLASPLGPLAANRYFLLALVVAAGLIITFASQLFSILSSIVNTKIEQSVIFDFRGDLFRHAQRLSIAYHNQASTARLIFGINFEAAAAGALITSILPLTQSVLILIGMTWISFQIDPTLALLSMLVVPFLYYSVGYYVKHIQDRLLAVKNMEAESLAIVHEALTMLRVIVAFGREPYEERRFRKQGKQTVNARVNITWRQTLFSLAVEMTTAVGTALVLGVGAYHVLQGTLTLGQLLVVLAYIAAIYKPLEQISGTIGSLQDQFAGLGMAFRVMDTEPLVQDAPNAAILERAQGRVTFERVSFSYPGRVETLQDISFDAQAGQVIALVGPTGAGKTTLMSLIPRFYDPSQGSVQIDGVDVRTVTLESLREQISVVLQEPLLFSGTIADNIRYGRLDATTDEIIQAAREANADDFIAQFPSGYDTEVGERGVQLSGGERQRICVARAFLKDAPILILDEPTSSIDSKTEAVILDSLDRLMLGRTTFMIAHRLSTVRHSDLILVLNQGHLVEKGTHEELVAQNGLYKQLYDMQIGQRKRKFWKLAPPEEQAIPLRNGVKFYNGVKES